MRQSRFVLPLLLFAPLATFAQVKPFPDTPLQTGNERPAANLWLILDDSGSMEWDYIPDNLSSATFIRKNKDKNPLAYDPSRSYSPWKNWDGSLMSGGQSYTSAYSDASRPRSPTNLWNSTQTYYVRKPNATLNPNSSNDYNSYYQVQIYRQTVSCGRNCSTTQEVFEVCDYTGTSGGTPRWQKNCQTGDQAANFISGRTVEQELSNYATWYSWHRTRMKTAKAGISETFSQLGPSVRVGYTSIWDRNRYEIPVRNGDNGVFRGSAKQTFFSRFQDAQASGSTNLHGALTAAGEYFRRTDSSGPWGPESGSGQFSCRQNFAILTSDGYWNNQSGYSPAAGNQDGTEGQTITNSKGRSYRYIPSRPFSDSYSDTLADVAMKYWKNDLRPDLENNVPTHETNPAFWQHMVTFGVSIGLKGTLNPNTDYQSIVNGSKSWPNPWRTDTNNRDSWSNESARRIDDLWHASINGHGEFFAATSPDEFTNALTSILSNVQRVLASGSNVSTSSTSLQTDTRIFHASYYSGIWSGEMAAYDISDAGISVEPNWIASAGIPSHGVRKAFTWDSGNNQGTTFPTTAQANSMREGFLSMNPAESGVSATQIANYIKGDRSQERANLGPLRNRDGVMGDVVNSSPVYSADTDTLFIGSNDGFLHAVNASTGAERFVYAPAGLNYSDLGTLASPDYVHKFFVDGQIAVSTRKQTPGKNLLVGALGRGGKGVFSLNVTNPGSFSASNVSWDRTVNVDNDMGYVTGEPLIAPGNNGRVLAIIPNGVGSVSNCSALFIYDLENGNELAKINTGACATGTNLNGLSSPRGWDSDGNGTVDEVYAGDLMGNLWKFDLTHSNPSQWRVAFNGQPLFVATSSSGARQPISGGLALGYEQYSGRRWVLFGTGRYLTTGDVMDTSTQSVYGIIDGSTTTNRAELIQRNIEAVSSGESKVRAFETYQPLPAGRRGWVVDLGDPYIGERVIERGYLAGRIFVFPSVIPTSTNACEASGRGFINAIDAFTGTSTSVDGGNHAYFDVGNDGNPNNDWIGPGGGATTPGANGALPIGSVETDIGMVTEPVLVGNQLVYGGSSGGRESRRVNIPPAAAKRLSWREVPAQ